MPRRALVLGAGGHAASAWEIGLIAGMAECGLDVRNADLLVGTSAGARVAVQLASGIALEDLFQRQIDALRQTAEPAPVIDWTHWRAEFLRAKEGGGSLAEVLRRIGAMAVTPSGLQGSDRRPALAAQLPLHTWPDRELLIAAVNAETGERRAFDRNSGIGLIEAVAASGAVAGIWRAVEFQGQHYIDGGFYSTDNADLAVGCQRVLIAALRSGVPPLSAVPISATVEILRGGGAQVEVVHPDEGTEAAFASVGGNLLHPSVCEPAARAGRAQGRRFASGPAAALWS